VRSLTLAAKGATSGSTGACPVPRIKYGAGFDTGMGVSSKRDEQRSASRFELTPGGWDSMPLRAQHPLWSASDRAFNIVLIVRRSGQ